ncbi:hypothetical protein BDR07DRAFT_1381888 [Suillus spraguei]|nr:hypothetical protein BDR07DRAFT_1381888 [Suillus spraguei]
MTQCQPTVTSGQQGPEVNVKANMKAKGKGKGKGKAKAKAYEDDGDEDVQMVIDVDDLPDVGPWKSSQNTVIVVKKKGAAPRASELVEIQDDEEDELDEDEEEDDDDTEGKQKATLKQGKQQKLSMKDNGKKSKGQQPMACICTNPESADSTTVTTTTPSTTTAPPATAVATRSKTSRSKATRQKISGQSKVKGKYFVADKNTQCPSPIQEEDIHDNVDVDIQMLDDNPQVTGPGSTAPAPLASVNDFPADHWIEHGDNNMPPPSPVMAPEDNIRFSPLPAMEAMLTQICVDMEELRTHDRRESEIQHDRLEHHIILAEASDSAMSMQIDEIERDARVQQGLLSECTAEVRGIVRYLRERSGQVTTSTPPAYNPPAITAPGPSINASWVSAQTGGDMLGAADGSPVARQDHIEPTSATIPSLTLKASGTSVPLVVAPPVQPPIILVPSNPSPGTIHIFLTGPSNAPDNGQSISAPLPCPRYGPLLHQGWSVSARHSSKPSSDEAK